MAQKGGKLLDGLTGQTATVNSEVQVSPPAAKGIILRVTAANGASTPDWTPKIQRKRRGGTTYDDYWVAGTAITADGTTLYLLYPGASGGDVTEVDAVPIPTEWRLEVTRSAGTFDLDADFDFIF